MTADTAAPAGTGTAEHKRATVRPDKAETVAALAEAFRTATATVLTDYRGLSVSQISDLRRALGADTTYAVVKNTLTTIAARDAGLAGLEDLLTGPTAVAFVNGDPVQAAKGLRDFAKAHPVLVVKGGVMDGRQLSVEEIRKLADLESREVLLAKMAGAMLASLSQAVYLLNAPLVQVARLAGALQAKAEADPSVLAAGAGTPAPAAEATEQDGAEAPADLVPVAEAEVADDTPAGTDDTAARPDDTTGTDDTPATTDDTASTDSTDSTTPA